jgi:hypothetical protein
LKQCDSNSDIFSITPNTTIDGVDAKENLKTIKSLYIKNAVSMQYFPVGIPKLFPNLKILVISNASLKALTKEDLKPFTKLQGLYFGETKMHVLESDMFKYSGKLEELMITNNPIRNVEPGTFKPLTKLVNFRFYNLCFLKETNTSAADEFDAQFEKIEESCNEKESNRTSLAEISIKCENVSVNNNIIFGNLKECKANSDINSTSPNTAITEVQINGSHAEITSLVIGYATNFHYLPNNVGGVFQKLRLLMIGDSGLKELKKENMMSLGRLLGLYIINTELASLEDNIFQHNGKLLELVIKGHKLKFVESGIFDTLTNTRNIVFKDNLCFDRAYMKDTHDVPLLYKEIYERCKKHDDDHPPKTNSAKKNKAS